MSFSGRKLVLIVEIEQGIIQAAPMPLNTLPIITKETSKPKQNKKLPITERISPSISILAWPKTSPSCPQIQIRPQLIAAKPVTNHSVVTSP